MKKHSLATSGLSMSQAASISNLCYQRAKDIEALLSGINNCQKELKLNGETYIDTVGKSIPTNVVDILLEKARLHATQAFLMENIKAKEQLLDNAKRMQFATNIEAPIQPQYEYYENIPSVDEVWALEQLTPAELAEFWQAEAYAAHIGQFIHKNGTLDTLRNELPKLKTLEWITVKDGEKTPLKVIIHHTPEQLLTVHEQLAALHRKYEQRVNYFKTKIKNLVTEENARIAHENADGQAETAKINSALRDKYSKELAAYQELILKQKQDFEAIRHGKIQEIAALRITIDPRFQDVIDLFLKQLE